MRPIGLFFISEPPDDPWQTKDFRSITDLIYSKMSSAFKFEIRLAWERRIEVLCFSVNRTFLPQVVGDSLNAVTTKDVDNRFFSVIEFSLSITLIFFAQSFHNHDTRVLIIRLFGQY